MFDDDEIWLNSGVASTGDGEVFSPTVELHCRRGKHEIHRTIMEALSMFTASWLKCTL